MSITRSLLALGLVLGASLALAAAPPNKQNQGKKHHSFHGVVVSVHHNKKGGGTIRVLVRNHQGRGKSALARGRVSQHLRTVHVTDATQFEKVMLQRQGKNKGQAQAQNQKQPASLTDVHRGQHVRIKTGPRGHTALEVDIVHRAGGQGKRLLKK